MQEFGTANGVTPDYRLMSNEQLVSLLQLRPVGSLTPLEVELLLRLETLASELQNLGTLVF